MTGPAKTQSPPHRPKRMLCGWPATSGLLAMLVLVLPAACAAPPPARDVDFVGDDTFSIQRPGEPGSTVTGIGCGTGEKEALFNARRSARFNLIGVLGPGHYDLQFQTLDRVPDPERICYEVQAVLVR